MQDGKEYYFLQPASDQAISVAKILHDCSDVVIHAVLLKSEKQSAFLDKIYESVIFVKDYKELPEDSFIVPFGAQTTEARLKNGDVKLASVTMTQAALNVYEKPAFLNFCEKHNLPVPKTYINEEEISDTDFPIFYKQRYEKGGGVRGFANNKQELPKTHKDELIYQEFINTPGTYGVGFIADKGVLVASFCHYEELSYPVSGGSAVVIHKVNDKRLKYLTEAFVKESSYSGWGLAEFKWCDKRHDYVYMEVNAKFWASCELAFRNEPVFIKKLFNIEIDKKEVEGLVYINRALNAGLFNAAVTIIKNNKLEKIIYPGVFRSILVGMLPKPLIKSIKKIFLDPKRWLT